MDVKHHVYLVFAYDRVLIVPKVIVCGWQDVKIQLLTHSLMCSVYSEVLPLEDGKNYVLCNFLHRAVTYVLTLTEHER